MASDNDNSPGEPDRDGAAQVEPDYRFTLANERTFLAWVRTALGLLAAAVAVVQLVPGLVIPGMRHIFGALLALLAILTAAAGVRRGSRSIAPCAAACPSPANAYLSTWEWA